jgi:hypothetical protein
MANTSPPTESTANSDNKGEIKPVVTPENLRKAAGVSSGDQNLDSGSDTVSLPDRLRDASGVDVLPKPGTANQEARRIESEANAGGPVRVYQGADMTLPDGTKSNGMTFTKNGQEYFAQTEGTNRQIFTVNRTENGLPVLAPAVVNGRLETAPKLAEVAAPAALPTLPGGALPTEAQLRREQNAAVLTGLGDQVQLAQVRDLAQARALVAQTEVRPAVTPEVRPAVTVDSKGLPVLDGKPPVLPSALPTLDGQATVLPSSLPTLDGKGTVLQPEVRNPTVNLGAVVATPDVRPAVLGDNKGATIPLPAADVTRLVTQSGENKPLLVDAKAFAALPPDKQAAALQQIADAQTRIATANIDRAAVVQQQVQIPLDKPARVADVPMTAPRVDLLNPLPGSGNLIPGQIPGQIRVDVKPGDGKPVEFKPAEIVPGVKPFEMKPAEIKPLEVKPFDGRPLDGKPAEVKPVDVKLADGRPIDGAKPLDPVIAAQLAAIIKSGDAAAMSGRVLVDASGQPMKGPDGLPLKVADLLAAQKAADLAGGLKVADSALTGKPAEGLKLGDKVATVAGDLTAAKIGGELAAKGTIDGARLPGADLKPLIVDGKVVEGKMIGPDGKSVDVKVVDAKLVDGKLVDAKLLDGIKPLSELKPPGLDAKLAGADALVKMEPGKLDAKTIDTVRAESAYQSARQPLPEALAGMAKDLVKPDGLATKTEAGGKLDGRPETQAQKVDAALANQQTVRTEADKNAATVRVEQVQSLNDKLDPAAQLKADKEAGKTVGDTASSAAKFDELIDKAKKQKDEDRLDEEELQNSRNAMMMALLAQKKQQQEQEEKEFQLRNEDPKNKGEDKRRRYVVKEKETLESIAKKQLRDVRLAALLYEINKHMLPIRMEKGKQVVDPRPGTAIWLPAEYEIKEFRGRLYAAPKPADAGKFATPEEELAQRFGSGWEGNTTRTSVADGMMGNAVAKSQARRENIEKILGPMANKGNDSQRIRYIVRLTDSIESVAQKHPALKDVSLWPLLASLNELTTDVDDAGRPLAELRRGMVLDIPLPNEIEQYRAFDDEESGDDDSASDALVNESAPLTAAPVASDVDWQATVQVPVSGAPVAYQRAAADQVASAQSMSALSKPAGEPLQTVAKTIIEASPMPPQPVLSQPAPSQTAPAIDDIAMPLSAVSKPFAPQALPTNALPVSPASAASPVTPVSPLSAATPSTVEPLAPVTPGAQTFKQALPQVNPTPVQPQSLQSQQAQPLAQQPHTQQPQVPQPQAQPQAVQAQPAVPPNSTPVPPNSTPLPASQSATQNPPSPTFQAPSLPAGVARPNPSNTFNSLLAVPGQQGNIHNAAVAASQAQAAAQPQSQPSPQLQPQPSSQTETNPILSAVPVNSNLPGAGRTAMSALDMPPINAGDRFIWQLDPSVRLVKSTMRWDPAVGVFRSQLELLLEDVWYPVIFYEVFPHMAVRHEYLGGGRKKSVKMDLPPTPAQELADNDLVNNWQRYCHNFVSQMNGPRTGPPTQA